MDKSCFFTKTACENTDDCTFWDYDRNTCKLYNVVNIETATNGKVTLNNSTFTKIVDANPARNGLVICSTSKVGDDKNIYISLSSTEDAIDGAGYYLKDAKIWPVPQGYVGEVCGKSELNNPIVTFVEW